MTQTSSGWRTAGSLIGLNVGWFACVLGAAWQVHWLGLVIVLLLCAVHIWAAGKQGCLCVVLLVLAALIVGLALDTTLIAADAYRPKRWLLPAPLPTLWLFMLWVNFSLALNESLKWLQTHLVWAALLGSLFGPLAYAAAQRLGAVEIARPVSGRLFLVSVGWFVAMPLLSHLASVVSQRCERLPKR
jgi:hypothetical protein